MKNFIPAGGGATYVHYPTQYNINSHTEIPLVSRSFRPSRPLDARRADMT